MIKILWCVFSFIGLWCVFSFIGLFRDIKNRNFRNCVMGDICKLQKRFYEVESEVEKVHNNNIGAIEITRLRSQLDVIDDSIFQNDAAWREAYAKTKKLGILITVFEAKLKS